MTASPINYFRNQAKALKKAVDQGKAQAVERAKTVLHGGISDFGLMKAQHVIAVEAGFASWGSLVASDPSVLQAAIGRSIAPDLAAQIQAVLDQQPDLTISGFWAPNQPGRRFEEHRTSERVRAERAEFFEKHAFEEIRAAMAYLDQLRPARVSSRTSPGSYGLKHDAEHWHAAKRQDGDGHVYVANGSLIVAALIKSLSIRRMEVMSPNCWIGVNPTDVDALRKGVDPATLRTRPSPFVRWLFKQAGRRDPVGDLASDAQADLEFPRKAGLDEVREYISRFSFQAMDALDAAATEWRVIRVDPEASH